MDVLSLRGFQKRPHGRYRACEDCQREFRRGRSEPARISKEAAMEGTEPARIVKESSVGDALSLRGFQKRPRWKVPSLRGLSKRVPSGTPSLRRFQKSLRACEDFKRVPSADGGREGTEPARIVKESSVGDALSLRGFQKRPRWKVPSLRGLSKRVPSGTHRACEDFKKGRPYYQPRQGRPTCSPGRKPGVGLTCTFHIFSFITTQSKWKKHRA